MTGQPDQINKQKEKTMNYCIMEQFPMARTGPPYGVEAADRVALFTKAKELGFDGIEFGLTHDYTADPFWTGDGDLRLVKKMGSD